MLTPLKHKLLRAWQLDARERRYFVTAAARLAAARVELSRRATRDILADLQSREAGGEGLSGGIDVPTMAWAIAAAANTVPWRADCLIQSIAASRWLRRHGIAPDFHLGVTSGEDGAFMAHAWVELDGMVLTGGNGVDRYHLLIGP
jgi:Transglutaminase-like superfamily